MRTALLIGTLGTIICVAPVTKNMTAHATTQQTTTLADILEFARQKIHGDQRQALPLAITSQIAEFGDTASFEAIYHEDAFVWTIGGKLPRSHGFDGSHDWEVDLMGMSRTLELADRDEARLRNWFVFGDWLNHQEQLEVQLDEAQSDQEHWAINVRMSEGEITALVRIVKDSGLPVECSLRNIHAETITLADYRPAAGRLVPHAIQRSAEQGDKVAYQLATVEHKAVSKSAFAMPQPQADRWRWVADNPHVTVMRANTGHVLVQTWINEEGPHWFILDTGAGGTVIDSEVAKKLQSRKLGEASVASMLGWKKSALLQLESLRVGPLEIVAPISMEMDLSFLTAPLGTKISGVIGYDVFSRCIAEIKLEPPRVNFYPADSSPFEDSQHWHPLSMCWRLPLMEGQLSDYPPGLFRIDIGAAGGALGNVVFHQPYVQAEDLLADRETTSFEMPPHKLEFGTADRFQFQGQLFEDIEVGFATTNIAPFNDVSSHGNIGVLILKRFTIVLDYQNNRYQMIPAESAEAITSAPTESDTSLNPAKHQDVEPQAVISKYLEKIGGVEKLNEVGAYEIKGEFQIPEAGLIGDLSLAQTGDKFLMQIEVGNIGVFAFGSNGREVWELNPQTGDRILDGDDRADAIRNYGRLVTELEYLENFEGKLTSLGSTEIDDRKCHSIQIDPQTGRRVVACFDVKSGLLVQTTTIRTAQGTDFEVVTAYDKYKQVGDLLLPHEFRANISGMIQVMKYEEITLNGEIDADQFALPEKLRDDQ